ncbi:PHP domain-containing protein [Natronolimnohabitans innermongolicus]|uniref:PHP domain-containing protein n=1 Tax=Natronolimnohabitans innermongolicus JCM 12255 TaxID=1227499 RepID=L9X2E9_9EURY|nr:PHP domain-containing protein [Natronolimnohabitans innermongolicus]ELY55934.1 PHP domain-containing protein [Natronolimnohabitans innermongolicus JCM 12255]
MPYADLHVHTTRSDGSLEFEEVPDAARENDVAVVAITDHDRLQPIDEPIAERDGVTIVSGIELRVETPYGERVDLLGYGVEPTAELEGIVKRIQRNRIERGQAIVDCVESRLGIDLGVTVEDGFGRPHVARAIDAHPDTDYDYGDAFAELIGNGEPCFVARDVPSFERGLAALSSASHLVSLAHPLRYADPEAALGLTAEPALEAVELHYPYDRDDVDPDIVEDAIERNDLLTTGGTDAHEYELGVAGLSRAAYDRIELS